MAECKNAQELALFDNIESNEKILSQIILNIMDNALENTGKYGTLRVSINA